jgi:hypothetical protein
MTLQAFPPIFQTASVTLKSTQPTRVSVSHSLRQQSRTTGAQRWALQLTLPPLTKAQFMPYFSFLLAHRGQADPFTIVVPTLTHPLGQWGSGVAVYNPQSVYNPAAADRGRTFFVSGLQGTEPAAKAGDLLKFAGHSKVYMVTADSDAVSGGFAQITVEPALLAPIAHNEAITVRHVPFTVVNLTDSLSSSISAGPLYSLTLDLVEVF